ncbi:MAG: alpha/beta hydrolase [Thermodesulfobacteriota bacterium]
MAIVHRMKNMLGGLVDEAFLLPPRIGKSFLRPRTTDRGTYEAEVDFYINGGFTERPETFFRLPEEPPRVLGVEKKPFKGGAREIVSFASGFTPLNPLVQDRYLVRERNRTGYLVRWVHGDRPRPTVLCMHGFMLGDPDQAERMFRVENLYAAGLDAALLVAPFHWRRAPGGRFASRRAALMPDDVARTAEFFGQAVWDAGHAFSLLEQAGALRVGVIGASLGGYIGGIFACVSDKPAFLAMMVPAVHFSRPFSPDGFRMRFPVTRELGEKLSRVWEFHSPIRMKPRISKDDILIIASKGDHLCPFVFMDELWESWGRPRRRVLSGGHWLIFDNRERGREWYSFLQDKGFLGAAAR